MSGRERRGEPRVAKVCLVSISESIHEEFEIGEARTLDLSAQGLRLEVFQAIPLRSVLRLTLAVGDRILTVEGIVKNLEIIDENRTRVGVQFTWIDPSDRTYLMDHLGTAP